MPSKRFDKIVAQGYADLEEAHTLEKPLNWKKQQRFCTWINCDNPCTKNFCDEHKTIASRMKEIEYLGLSKTITRRVVGAIRRKELQMYLDAYNKTEKATENLQGVSEWKK